MERKEFLNRNDVYECFSNLFYEVVEDYGYEKCLCEDLVEEEAFYLTEKTLSDMKKYVHKSDTKLCGNFCNIREDWDITKSFVESDVEPFGKFDEIIKSIDDDTISDDDLQKFQTWALDWYFTAFGTWGLKYNFGDTLINFVEEMESEDAA